MSFRIAADGAWITSERRESGDSAGGRPTSYTAVWGWDADTLAVWKFDSDGRARSASISNWNEGRMVLLGGVSATPPADHANIMRRSADSYVVEYWLTLKHASHDSILEESAFEECSRL